MNNISDNGSGIRQRFLAIEEMATENLDESLLGMIELFPQAADSYHHDIVDSIVMWIGEKGTRTTLIYLKKQILVEEDEYCLEIFQDLVSLLEKRLGTEADDLE
jgi:hypothetical protein